MSKNKANTKKETKKGGIKMIKLPKVSNVVKTSVSVVASGAVLEASWLGANMLLSDCKFAVAVADTMIGPKSTTYKRKGFGKHVAITTNTRNGKIVSRKVVTSKQKKAALAK